MTVLEFLDFFIQDIQELSLHLFNWKWHDQQFDYIKEHLQPGMLLQVLDFAQNYMNKYQDEPKECHWDHLQTVLHPIINHRHCAIDGKLIVEEHVIISNDLNRDKHAVKAFEDASMMELQRSGFKPTHIMQFCDNCSSQYKSKGPFQSIANADIPTIRSYFGSNHRKGPSDSATGQVKSAIIQARNARVSELKNTQEVFEFLQQKFKEWEERRIKKSGGKCIHFFQKALFVTDIDHTEEISAVTTKGSSNFSTVRSTGIPFVIESRNVACLCPNCLFGDTYACPRGSDAQRSLQLPSVSCNIQSRPTSPSVTSTANENSDSDFCENTDVSVEQDLDTRIQMCANFGALADLFDSHEPFAPIDYTVAKMCRSHRLDTDALKYKPSMHQKVTILCRFLAMEIASLELWPLQ